MLLLECQEGRRVVENGVSDAESALLDAGLGAEPSLRSDGGLDESSKGIPKEGMHFLGAVEEAPFTVRAWDLIWHQPRKN